MADATARETAADRRRRRDRFLRALNEARAVRNQVRPRQARAARMRRAIHMRTFSW
ncbi:MULTISPECIES: hypothetical protein [Streptomyces]|uniref:Uncharacterized protein n=1 Tax=Streptomyces iranensis TaxID=576784 RepID=A0A060ZR08_9ACTN|nr:MULTISPECIES: hypothetical protein [Streptomyces]MBP2065291.1 hypothetical protein [Streptomyces iranensis]CDR08622.1 predicted protein [Streptomyces iranensis]